MLKEIHSARRNFDTGHHRVIIIRNCSQNCSSPIVTREYDLLRAKKKKGGKKEEEKRRRTSSPFASRPSLQSAEDARPKIAFE